MDFSSQVYFDTLHWRRETEKNRHLRGFKEDIWWAVVVARLVERLLLTPEVHGSNQFTGKFYIKHLFTVNTIENAKITKKRPGMAHFYNYEDIWSTERF